MRSRAFLLCATAMWLLTCGLARGGGLDGGFAGGPLTGAGGFTPLQRGFASPSGPWLSGAPAQFGRSQPGFLPRYPGGRGHGWRGRPYGSGVGFVYPYVDDYGEEYIEEEPVQQSLPPPPVPPAPPKPSAGPKTVSAPPAAVAPASSSSTNGGPVHCGAGRKVTMGGASNGGFGCISP